MKRSATVIAAGAVAALLAACGASDGGGGAPAGPPTSGVIRPVADVAGVHVGLSAQVWLDRMPGPPAPAGAPAERADRPLHVTVQLAASGGLPEGVAIDRLWVRAGERTWETALAYLVRADGRLEGGAAGGPAVAEGVPATVTVRVTAPDGVRYLATRLPQVTAAY